jgi:hypothetical protein
VLRLSITRCTRRAERLDMLEQMTGKAHEVWLGASLGHEHAAPPMRGDFQFKMSVLPLRVAPYVDQQVAPIYQSATTAIWSMYKQTGPDIQCPANKRRRRTIHDASVVFLAGL